MKTDQLFKVLKNTDFDSEKVKQDKEFLNFFGKLRNSVHSNYIYYGKDYEFNHVGMTYKFEKGKPIKQDPLSDLSFFNLSIELRNVYQRLIEKIKFVNLIPDRNYVGFSLSCRNRIVFAAGEIIKTNNKRRTVLNDFILFVLCL